MKKLLLFACAFFCLLSFKSIAQYYPGLPIDSTMITFKTSDSLAHLTIIDIYDSVWVSVDTTINDTANMSSIETLWQIGNTIKPIFSNSGVSSRGIMTDTTEHYPSNSNSSFIIKLTSTSQGFAALPNPLVEIWHEYQTDSFHAGGIIEFSTDSGATWINIFNCPSPISTQNQITDTLFSGQQAFMGTSDGQQFSSFYFFDCIGEKTTLATNCSFLNQGVNNIYLRFRFQSDTTEDTLSGWKIDSIKIVFIGCGGGVPKVNTPNILSINPNPAFNGIFNSPAMDDEQKYTIDVFNALGDKIFTMPYGHTVNISSYAKGLYFYKVTGNNEQYSGKLLYE